MLTLQLNEYYKIMNKEDNNVKSRLLTLLKIKHMSQTEFCRKLGVSPTYIGAMRKSIPSDKMKIVCNIFPDLNRDWLLYGEGEMLNTGIRQESSAKRIPLLPVEAFAGRLLNWSMGVNLSTCQKILTPTPAADFAIRITGDSMEPVFHSGSILFIKRIDDISFIPWGNPMVIDTCNGVLVKVLYPSTNIAQPISQDNKSNYSIIEARSYNAQYPPIMIPTESIYGIYRILTCMQEFNTI